jgi:hypothetical protein
MQGNPRELSMPRTVGVGLLFVVALTACAHFKRSPSPAAEAPARSAPDVQPSSDGLTAVAASDTLPATPPAELPATAAASPPSPSPSTVKPAQPKTAGNGNSRSPRGPGSSAGGSSKPSLAAEQHGAPAAAQTAVAQPVAKPPASPPLDLAGLEQRLKDTHAIGLFTKLSLKNQVDDLLGAFRAFHGGQTQPPLADLRQRYDLLLLKVLTLLQDGDPPLASAISASREAIWALLADRDKFQKIQMG